MPLRTAGLFFLLFCNTTHRHLRPRISQTAFARPCSETGIQSCSTPPRPVLPWTGVRIVLLDMRTIPSGSVAWYQHRLFPTRFKTRESTVSRLECSPETDCHICFLGRWEIRPWLHVQLPEREGHRSLSRQTPLRMRRTRRYPLLLSVGASACSSWACNLSAKASYHATALMIILLLQHCQLSSSVEATSNRCFGS